MKLNNEQIRTLSVFSHTVSFVIFVQQMAAAEEIAVECFFGRFDERLNKEMQITEFFSKNEMRDGSNVR